MIIGGLEKLSLLDYPGHLAAVVFTQGCNFRCHFCYNPQLVLPNKEKGPILTESDLFLFLKNRLGKLEGVVITGGEPTLHPDLPQFIKAIKDLGYLIKLDSNGTNPKMLRALIKAKLIDYIAMDIKAPLDKYSDTVGVGVDCDNIKKSVKIIMTSGLPYEFRTTLVPGLIVPTDLKAMGKLIKGASKWYLQKFKSDTDLVDFNFKAGKSFTSQEMKIMAAVGGQFVDRCELRA
ncbi:MAG: anaerobic ribonucleoside-triphosphate reductase activating protein [Candidatus Falkowbacteria bacterium]|nr:anaerobic ribonucleoside-triphosphate reductase activating protein [Candidatus Falkowbacteria bacterium]